MSVSNVWVSAEAGGSFLGSMMKCRKKGYRVKKEQI